MIESEYGLCQLDDKDSIRDTKEAADAAIESGNQAAVRRLTRAFAASFASLTPRNSSAGPLYRSVRKRVVIGVKQTD